MIPCYLGDVVAPTLHMRTPTRRAPRNVCKAVVHYSGRMIGNPRLQSQIELLKQEYVLFVVGLHGPLIFLVTCLYSRPQIHTLVVCLGTETQLLTHKIQLVGYELELLTHGTVQINAL